MAHNAYVNLETRAILCISGEDRDSFLQGLISNDINKLAQDRALHAALLSAQGRYQHDFFIVDNATCYWLDCERERLADLRKRLSIYRLRAKVEISDPTDQLSVIAITGPGACAALGLADEAGSAAPLGGGIAFVDPRLSAMGCRAILPTNEVEALMADRDCTLGDMDDYESLRIGLGLADGSRDMEVDKALLLENGFSELGSVDWQKGCYLGQELTARTRYRGLVKKRLMPVEVAGPLPQAGTPIICDGKEAGEIKSGAGTLALALIRLTALESGASLIADQAKLTPRPPEWAVCGSDHPD